MKFCNAIDIVNKIIFRHQTTMQTCKRGGGVPVLVITAVFALAVVCLFLFPAIAYSPKAATPVAQAPEASDHVHAQPDTAAPPASARHGQAWTTCVDTADAGCEAVQVQMLPEDPALLARLHINSVPRNLHATWLAPRERNSGLALGSHRFHHAS